MKKKHFIFINNKNRKHIKIKNKKDNLKKKKLKHVPSLKKPRDFTVPEGHGYPLGVHTSLLFKTNVTRCSKSTQSFDF
jgi:hypothetical protein